VHALGVPVAPLGHRDRRRTVDEQARLGADLLQVGVVVREESHPAFQTGLAAQQVALAGVARAVGQHQVVRHVARVPRPRDEVIDRGRRRQAALAVEAPPVLQFPQGFTDLK
jgi:hypothetical protein